MAKQRNRRTKVETGLVQEWGTTEKRIEWLLQSRFHGNKTAMADALHLTHMVITRVITGQRPPGPRLIRAIIEQLGVDTDWLLRGRGEPFPGTAGRASGGRIPVFDRLLTGRLTGRSDQQAERWLDGAALLAPSQYWFFLASGHPLLADRRIGLMAGDLVLLETDPTRFPPTERLRERLCVVKNPDGREPPVKFGLVSYFEASVEGGPERLEVDTFDGVEPGTVEEFVFRRYPGGEVRSLHRKLSLTRGGTESPTPGKGRTVSEPMLPELKYGDIEAVWTGILIRSGYAGGP